MISKATQKRVARVRKQIEAGIAKAKSLGLGLAQGVWCSGMDVCPLAAVIVTEKGIKVTEPTDLSPQLYSRFYDATNCLSSANTIAAGLLRITPQEAEYFYQGFDRSIGEYANTKDHLKQLDDKPTERRVAMYQLGRRLRAKYAA